MCRMAVMAVLIIRLTCAALSLSCRRLGTLRCKQRKEIHLHACAFDMRL